MNRSLQLSPGAFSKNKAQCPSFGRLIFSLPFQSAYWLNKNYKCYNWCVDTLGNDRWNMVFKLWLFNLCLSYSISSCFIFGMCFVCSVMQLDVSVYVMHLISCLLDFRHMPDFVVVLPDSWWIKCICMQVFWLSYGQ